MKKFLPILIIFSILGCTQEIVFDNSSLISIDNSDNTTNQTVDQTPQGETEEALFTTSFFEMEKIDYIIPLGNLNPPGHTLPTRHMYFWLKEQADLIAPARIHVSNIHYFMENGDYEIGFQVSDDVSGYFIHIETICPRLEAVVTYNDCEGDLCFTDVDLWFEEGEFIGQAGINKMSFDLGIIDNNVQNEFAKPERYRDELINAACGLDYFSEEIRSQYYGKLRREGEPLCGTITQDVAGTLQGNWFSSQDAEAYSHGSYEGELGFVHHAENFSLGIITIENVFTDPGAWGFTPTHSGFINREPSEVTADGNIYCYHRGQGQERIVVQMLNEERIIIEYQENTCDELLYFMSPYTYYR